MPARRVQCHLDLVGGRRDRARPHRDPAHRQSRVAVQREDARHAVERARGDGVDRAAGHQLLGGLEDQPHADRQLGHRASASAAPSSTAVCASWPQACATLGTTEAYVHPGALGHRQRVHIGAQRDARPVLRTEVADQARSAGQHLRVQPGVGQMRRDELSGGELLAPQFGVGVDVPAPGHQLVVVGGEPVVRGFCQFHDAARLACSSSIRSRSSGDLGEGDDRARQHDRAFDDGLVAAGTRGGCGEARLMHRRPFRVDADDGVDARHDLRDVAHIGAAQRHGGLDLLGDRFAAESYHFAAKDLGQPLVRRQFVIRRLGLFDRVVAARRNGTGEEAVSPSAPRGDAAMRRRSRASCTAARRGPGSRWWPGRPR